MEFGLRGDTVYGFHAVSIVLVSFNAEGILHLFFRTGRSAGIIACITISLPWASASSQRRVANCGKTGL